MAYRRYFLTASVLIFSLAAVALPIRLMAQTTEPAQNIAPTEATVDPNAPPIPRVHIVQDGENLTLIAINFGVTVEDILAINNLANGDLLQVGQELIIPGGTGEAIATTYAVAPGDTLTGIAAAFNTSIGAVVATNRIIIENPPLIVGQRVSIISRSGSTAARPVSGRAYLVEPGDTLLLVAAQNRISLAELAAANGLTTGSYLFPGQRLRIPEEGKLYRDLPEGWVDVRLSSPGTIQGATLSIFVENLLPGTPAGRFGKQPLHFAPNGEGYVALVGIDAFDEPGVYDLEISGGDERRLWEPLRIRLPLVEGGFDTQYIDVDEALDGLLDPAVRATEDEFLKTIYTDFDEDQRWEGVFQTPLTTTIVSAAYGGRRSYNGGPIEIYHTGIDYAAAQGTTVLAPANGVVVFSAPLELRGNVIIIDHGLGVMTGYYHLLESLVKPGESVTAGQPIGRVGSTGLSTGAHLHWDLRVMDVTVDPALWTQRAFP